MLLNMLGSLLNQMKTDEIVKQIPELKKARKQAVTGENETEEAIEKLDSILKELHDNAVKQEAE